MYLKPATLSMALGSGVGVGLPFGPTADLGDLQPWVADVAPTPPCSGPSPASQHGSASGLAVLSERLLFARFSGNKAWNLGLSNAKLSYYDGMIQLSYKDGTPYNNEKHTPRATLITFLCDREAGVGLPEYQVGAVRRALECGLPSLMGARRETTSVS